MIEDKIAETLAFIGEQLAQARRPVVACSFGKDSMVLLDLVRRVSRNVPVLYFQGIAHPTKHAFAERVIQLWDLKVIRPEPVYTDAIRSNNHVEIVHLYELAPGRFMYFPIEAHEGYVPDQDCACGMDMANQTPPVVPSLNFDCLFNGHRGDDIDPTYGAVPLQSDVVEGDGFRVAYPLKDWTEADIWEASKLLSIPQNEARYSGDLSANNDYYPLCTECLKTGDDKLLCPKLNLLIPRAGNDLNLDARKDLWRSVFVNIA